MAHRPSTQALLPPLSHPLSGSSQAPRQGLCTCCSFWNTFPAHHPGPVVQLPLSRSQLQDRLLRGALRNCPSPRFPCFGPLPFISLLSSYCSLQRCWLISRVPPTELWAQEGRETSRSVPPQPRALGDSRTSVLPRKRLGPATTRPPRYPAAPAPVFTFRVGGRVRGGGAPLPGRGGQAGRRAVSRPVWSPAAAVVAVAVARRRHRLGSGTMSGEWRLCRCHPARLPRLPPLQLYTPAPESPRPARSQTPVPSLADPRTRGSWPPVTCTSLASRVQTLPVPCLLFPAYNQLLHTCPQTLSLSQSSDPLAQSPSPQFSDLPALSPS